MQLQLRSGDHEEEGEGAVPTPPAVAARVGERRRSRFGAAALGSMRTGAQDIPRRLARSDQSNEEKGAGSLLFGVCFGAHEREKNELPPAPPPQLNFAPRSHDESPGIRILGRFDGCSSCVCCTRAELGPSPGRLTPLASFEPSWRARSRAFLCCGAEGAREGTILTVPKRRSSCTHRPTLRWRPRFEALGRLLKRRRPPFRGVLRRQRSNQIEIRPPQRPNSCPRAATVTRRARTRNS